VAPGQQVPASRFGFPGIAGSLELCLHAEAGAPRDLRDVRHLQEAEVDVDLDAPPLVQVPNLEADVEGDERQACAGYPLRPGGCTMVPVGSRP
jgi:hypothetical protein